MTATDESVQGAVTEAFVEANGLRIYYRETDEGPPNADHGAGDRKVFWAAVADFLSRHAPDASAA